MQENPREIELQEVGQKPGWQGAVEEPRIYVYVETLDNSIENITNGNGRSLRTYLVQRYRLAVGWKSNEGGRQQILDILLVPALDLRYGIYKSLIHMDKVPQEIKNEILNYACDNVTDAANCALVDRTFRWQAQEALFRILNVSGSSKSTLLRNYSWSRDATLRYPSVEKTLRKLLQFPTVQSHIRVVVFHSGTLGDGDASHLIRILDCLSRITDVVFRGLVLNNDSEPCVKRLLPSLAPAEGLHFKWCKISLGVLSSFKGACYYRSSYRHALVDRDRKTSELSLSRMQMRASILCIEDAHRNLLCGSAFAHVRFLHLVMSNSCSNETETVSPYDGLCSLRFQELRVLWISVSRPVDLQNVNMILRSATELTTLEVKFCLHAYKPIRATRSRCVYDKSVDPDPSKDKVSSRSFPSSHIGYFENFRRD
ncbi:hypothetical protein ARMSODRAFT_978332 [Armillaria solidipes]|uniref:Uncharacterized protein n=1 Tax=Armillaria solidipes TaxID=1076256 RepID=A0A2H3B3V2_9AGAR|nr:hypothetical protein ARMSODRAFT_978332 [Armillaria solidipes]